ncbi:hypothetical protein CGZ80_08370 [Rhodopirellula sp. MGV]|nr:hypothetical protein CGZ80_08370 [Rhodopirellula sp. MGV]PNY38441.1 hypothetical protein C2E31_00410 [Rhodopirellula baltica]
MGYPLEEANQHGSCKIDDFGSRQLPLTAVVKTCTINLLRRVGYSISNAQSSRQASREVAFLDQCPPRFRAIDHRGGQARGEHEPSHI